MTPAMHVARWGLLGIVVLMPFHAFLTTWAGDDFGNRAVWQAWKEAVLAATAISVAWMALRKPSVRERLNDKSILAAATFAIIAVLVTLAAQPGWREALYGAKTDFAFIVAFAVAIAVAGRSLRNQLVAAILAGSAIVSAFGLLQILVLPNDFLTRFGYGAGTIPPFLHAGETGVRILSTLGGPNQLGSYLILPICLTVALMIRGLRWWQPLLLPAQVAVMWFTFSRSAWLGLAAGLAITIIMSLPRDRRLIAAAALAAIILTGTALTAARLQTDPELQYYVLHGPAIDTPEETSTELHQVALMEGVRKTADQPLGQGLGTAGPASFYGDEPFIPESYYLQLAIEAGIAGLLAFLAMQLLVARQLFGLASRVPAAPAFLGALAGISIVNLFLHGWADSSTALIYWIAAGAVIGDQT